MQFRTATNGDGSEVRALVAKVLVEYGLPPEPGKTDACLNDIEESYIMSGGVFEVISGEDQRILGCYGLLPISKKICELRKMYFLPELRGKGIGKKTLLRALEAAKKAGFNRVELTTAASLKEAICLYEKFGFQIFEHSDLPKRCDRAMYLDLNQILPGTV